MSIEALKTAFEGIRKSSNCSLLLLKIKTFKETETKYYSRQIQLEPASSMTEFIEELTGGYLSAGKNSLDYFSAVADYDGTASATTIYRLEKDNPLIANEYESFLTAVANPDVEADAFSFTSAYVLKCSIVYDNDLVPVKLVSMQNPVTRLKQKYRLVNPSGKFSPMTASILTLRTSVDVVILRDKVYFLTLAGENLFNMARAYKTVCRHAVSEVESAGILSSIGSFRPIAESGHNPRRFVSFDRERLNMLKDTKIRKEMAARFSIPLDDENRFDTSIEGAAERIVKLLCKKGMVDPFNHVAVEVSGAKQWQ